MQNSNYSQTSSQACDTDGQESDLLECCRCNLSVEQILALQCDHNLCLGCASQIVKQWSQKYEIEQNFPPLRCEICLVCTQVDPSAIMILRQMSQSQTQQNIQCQNSSRSREDSSEKLQDHSDYTLLSKQEPNMFQSLQHAQNPLVSSQFNDAIYLFQGLSQNQQFNDSKILEEIKNDQRANDKNYDKNQSNFSDKRLEFINLTNQAKFQIRQSFNEIYSVLAKKEQELLQAADEIIQQKLQDFDNEINKLKQIFASLDQYYKSFAYLFKNQNQSNDSYQVIESFNFVSNNKEKIENIMENFTNNTIMQNHNIQLQFSLDPSSIQNLLEEIKTVRLMISSLRGIETNHPTSREKEVFEKAKEERRLRLLQNIVQENQKIPNGFNEILQTNSKANQRSNDLSIQQQEVMKIFPQKPSKVQLKENEEKKDNNTFSFIKRNFSENQQYSNQIKTQEEPFDFRRNFQEAKKQICDRIR